MKGKYRIVIENKRIRYDFEIKRNITLIRGDSATGKTILVDMVREFDENGTDSGINLKCEKKCTALSGRNWEASLSVIQDSIVFIDEGNRFVASREFAAYIQKTDNYYVIVAREGLPTLPYSVEEVYGIRNSGKYGTLKQVYNEFYHLYGKQDDTSPIIPRQVITEDSNAGFQFFAHICKRKGKNCLSAQGKSNLFSVALSTKAGETLIVADGAAFGSEIEKLLNLMKLEPRFHLYLPESFEWMILKSGLLEDRDLKKILDEPYDYIESAENFSWERFFTKLLIALSADSYLKYSKNHLNPVYIKENIADQILKVMQKIVL